MNITNFKTTGFDDVERFLISNEDIMRSISIFTLESLLKTSSIRFVIEGINRLHSMLICETGISVVQESQRYVSNTTMSGVGLEIMPPDVVGEFNTLEAKSIELYTKMRDDGIPIEDARYILPLTATTKMSLTMTGDQFVRFMVKMYEYNTVCKYIINELRKQFKGSKLFIKIIALAQQEVYETGIVDKFYNEQFNAYTSDKQVGVINMDWGIPEVAIGASMSSGIDISGFDITKQQQIVERVIGYSHTSILEQARNTFIMRMSITTYHQFIRHRMQSVVRPSLSDIIPSRGIHTNAYVIPNSISDSKVWHVKVLELIQDYIKFNRKYCYYNKNAVLAQCMLNCFTFPAIVSSNLRSDVQMFRERLCNRASSEIRNLASEKYWLMRDKYTTVLDTGRPSCVTDKCKEGAKSCGKSEEMQAMYNA